MDLRESQQQTTWLQIILTILSVVLICSGIYLGFQDKTSSSTALLGFGFLLFILLLLAKFKRFKGFGFEAEMWEQEQERAYDLISHLETISALLIEQLALLCGTIGYKTADLPIERKERLLTQLEELAHAMKHEDTRIRSELKPLIERLCRDYCWEVDWPVEWHLKKIRTQEQDERQGGDRSPTSILLDRLSKLKSAIWSIDPNCMDELRRIIDSSKIPQDDKRKLIANVDRNEARFNAVYKKLDRVK